MYKIGVISDTHGLLRENVKDVLRTCDAILHGGDINTPNIMEQLKAIAPVYAVRGNADKEWAAELPQTLSIELFGIKIYMVHNKKMIPEDIRDRDIVIYGHSHKYEELRKDGQIWLNPGSCGARRFSLPVTMAVITIKQPDGKLSQPRPASQPASFPFSFPCLFQIERIDLAAVANGRKLPKEDIKNMKETVLYVMKETDKGRPVASIAKSCHISEELATQICRLYLTHPGVSADGILTKMGL